MAGHHLILGELTDFITGDTLDDTLDERHRQKLARYLVKCKGYGKHEIQPRQTIIAAAGDRKARVPLDFRVTVSSQTAMIVKYGPGSIVTRRRPAVAMSRLCAPYQVPVIVVTNAKDAEVIDGTSGTPISTGIESIPSRHDLELIIRKSDHTEIKEKILEIESRILYAYEVDGACPCDDSICQI